MAFAKVVINQTGAIREFEKPEVCKAIKVANANKWVIGLSPTEWDERKARLKKEHEENTKAPGSGREQPNEGNPALAESASQFNDALLEEQAKEIESLRDKCKKYADILDSVGDKLRELKAENRRIKDSDLNLEGLTYATRELKEKNKEIAQLTKENEDLKSWRENQNKEISRLNKIIHKKNLKIEGLGKESSRHLEGKMKMFGENFDLEQELKDKNAVLSDVAEELRISKIREKNLTEVCQKYVKEVEDLREQLANKVVDKIDAQALKSAESALAWKEKKIAEKDEVIAELREKLKSINMNRHNERICKKQLAEKDEVIADLGKELAEAKKHRQQAYRSCADKNKEIRALKLQISALEKRGNGIDWKRNADAIKLYVNRASHERLWSPISQDICNEQELSFIINHGGKRVKYALRFDGTDIVYECSDPDKKNRHNGDGLTTPEEPKHDNSFKDFISKTIDNFNRIVAELGCVGGKDGNGILDQMVGVDIAEEGEDYYGKIVLCDKICTRKIEEIEIEKAVKLVRKAMKEGHTVTINYKD